MQLFVGKQLIRRVIFKRPFSVGLSDKHKVESDFLYGNPEKWNWRLMKKQHICIKNGWISWLTASGNNFYIIKIFINFYQYIFSHSQSESTKHYLLKSLFCLYELRDC